MATNNEQGGNSVGSWLNYDRVRVWTSERSDPDIGRSREKRRAKSAEKRKAKRADEWQVLEAKIVAWRTRAPPEKHYQTYAELLQKNTAKCAARRERERAAGGRHCQADLDEIRKRQDDRCRYCFTPLKGKGFRDHIVPLVSGGSNDPDNLQWTCKRCSGFKGSKPEQQFLAEMLAG